MDMRHWKDDAGNVQVVWNPDRDAEYSPRGDEVDGPREDPNLRIAALEDAVRFLREDVDKLLRR